jgi:hypothetical protein
MNKRYDYKALERQYVMGDMSLRELAETNGITAHSLVMEKSKANDWVRKREEYRNRADDKAMEILASDEGRRIAKEVRVRENAIDAIDEAISKMRADMQRTTMRMKDGNWVEEPLVVIKPNDIAILIDRLQVLFGKPSNITEERSLGIHAIGNDPDFLAALVEATRGRGAPAGDMGGSPLPRAERARSN